MNEWEYRREQEEIIKWWYLDGEIRAITYLLYYIQQKEHVEYMEKDLRISCFHNYYFILIIPDFLLKIEIQQNSHFWSNYFIKENRHCFEDWAIYFSYNHIHVKFLPISCWTPSISASTYLCLVKSLLSQLWIICRSVMGKLYL